MLESLSWYTATRFSGGRKAFMQAYSSSVLFGDEMGRIRAFIDRAHLVKNMAAGIALQLLLVPGSAVIASH
jgi:hypothetical protein